MDEEIGVILFSATSLDVKVEPVGNLYRLIEGILVLVPPVQLVKRDETQHLTDGKFQNLLVLEHGTNLAVDLVRGRAAQLSSASCWDRSVATGVSCMSRAWGALLALGSLTGGESSDDGMSNHLERARKTSSDTGHARRYESNSWTAESKVQDQNFVKGASQ
jgi:hypothetical protein